MQSILQTFKEIIIKLLYKINQFVTYELGEIKEFLPLYYFLPFTLNCL